MKKIKLLFWAIMLCFSSHLKAQIVYTDINPDTIIAASAAEQIKSYFLDLNNNGSYEFELRHFNPGPGMESVELQSNANGLQEVLITASGHALVKSITENIAPGSGNWGLDQFGILDDPWYTSGDKYFGMRFKINAQWHYGWARINIATDRLSFTVKDYAYQQTPNVSINAGQSVTGIGNLNAPCLSVYPNPFTSFTTFSLSLPAEDVEFNLWNAVGQKITPSIHSDLNNLVLIRSDLKHGLYFYQIRSRKDGNSVSSGSLIIAD
ncbi:MAG: T9SS type A sorting domain-containing protein [Bacteroidia bacterium]